MDKDQYLNKLHTDILLIMDEVVRVCEENGLKYYLIGGTLLGAVRHKGFIPWDDDLDIVMPREDYMKFISLCDKELTPPYKLDWITTNKDYGLSFAKVYNSKTRFENIDGISFGIFVDVFPLDTTNGLTMELKLRWEIIRKLKTLMFCKFTGYGNRGIKKILGKSFSMEGLHRILTTVCISKTKLGEYYTNFGSQYGVKKQTILKKYYGEGKLLPFEDRYYKVPSDYKAVLLSIFGENYMNLPSEDKRKTHLPKKVIFSSGEEVVFDD